MSSLKLAAWASSPMYRSIDASSRWVLSVTQLEDVRRDREAPTFVFSGAYVAARRRHGPMMLISTGLLLDRVDDLRNRVTHLGCQDSRKEIEVAASLVIPDVAPLAPHERDRLGVVKRNPARHHTAVSFE
jgi:hypothetical protein